MRNMVDASPYFQEYFQYDKNKESQMMFPNRVIVKPVSGHDTATIGENVIGGLIDEVNYMAVIEKSKKSIDGEQYDQATANYNALALRRKNRFMQNGKQPGILNLVSSRRYPGQFTDKKETEAKEELEKAGRTTIYIYDKRSWDIHDASGYGGKWFKVFTGNLSKHARMLEEDEQLPPEDAGLVVDIPEEFRDNFKNDMNQALRDVAGISTLAKHPYISNTGKVSECFGHHESILSLNETDFLRTIPSIYPRRFYKPTIPRWAHIDLATTGDAAGLSIGFVEGFRRFSRGAATGGEMLHHIQFDLNLRITPPQGGEIIFEKIRSLLYLLRESGLNIKWVSCDAFQSVDTLQILASRGFQVLKQSVDTDMMPYDQTKSALMDGRLRFPQNEFLKKEFASLELNQRGNQNKGKVDHPPNFSKDVADSVAGVVFGLMMRREIYAMHNISPSEVPEVIKQVVVKTSDRMAYETDRKDKSQVDVIAEVHR